MPAGETENAIGGVASSPIVRAIAQAESGTSGEIRVHLSKRPIERDPLGRAMRLFERYGMSRTSQRNGILLYVNLRRRKLAIISDSGFTEAVGSRYLDQLARQLREHLLATHPERAIALAVMEIGEKLRKHFLAAPEATPPPEGA